MKNLGYNLPLFKKNLTNKTFSLAFNLKLLKYDRFRKLSHNNLVQEPVFALNAPDYVIYRVILTWRTLEVAVVQVKIPLQSFSAPPDLLHKIWFINSTFMFVGHGGKSCFFISQICKISSQSYRHLTFITVTLIYNEWKCLYSTTNDKTRKFKCH